MLQMSAPSRCAPVICSLVLCCCELSASGVCAKVSDYAELAPARRASDSHRPPNKQTADRTH